jgi:hypothetical protein
MPTISVHNGDTPNTARPPCDEAAILDGSEREASTAEAEDNSNEVIQPSEPVLRRFYGIHSC